MVIFEKRKLTTAIVLKKAAEILGKISLTLGQLARTLAILDFSVDYLGEGMPADKEFVQKKTIELQSLITELDNIHPVF
jgi:hypothetical protein